MPSEPRLPSLRWPSGGLATHLALTAWLFCAAPLAAEASSPPRQPPREATQTAYAWDPQWRRFGPWDYAATAAVLSAYYAVEFSLGPPARAQWTKPVPGIDEPSRNFFRLDTRQARERADRASDVFWYTSVAYPVVDSIVTPLVRGADFDLIWQMSMMNVQAFAVTSLLIRIPHKTLGRLRPNDLGCQHDPNYDAQCESLSSRLVSFPGGHLAVSTTGAGLTCAHHLHGDLYGGGAADALACGGALGVAWAVAITRLQADRHWMSDQILGGLLGFGVGYGLPTLLYYHPFWRGGDVRDRTDARTPRGFAAVLLPMLGPDEYGATATGLF